MHAVQEAFDYAEGNQASDVDASEEVEVFEDPVFEGEALAERRVELDQGCVVDAPFAGVVGGFLGWRVCVGVGGGADGGGVRVAVV